MRSSGNQNAAGDLRVLHVLSKASGVIAEGEVLQLMNCNDPDTTEEHHMEVIYRKTAKLFEAGVLIGAILAGQTRAVEDALASYGRNLGTAFQLVDDALDYDPNARGTATFDVTYTGFSQEAEDAFQVRKQQLDLLPQPHRHGVLFGFGDVAGDLAGVFVLFAGNLAGICVRAALRL